MAEAIEQARQAAEQNYKKIAAAAPPTVQTELVMIQAISGQAREDFGRLARQFDNTVAGQGGDEGQFGHQSSPWRAAPAYGNAPPKSPLSGAAVG